MNPDTHPTMRHLLSHLAHPIISAPMAGASGGELAAVVSNAGGLGLVAIGQAASYDYIGDHVDHMCAHLAPEHPWGAGFMSWALATDPSPLAYFLERASSVESAYPPVVALSAGDSTPHAAYASKAGALVAVQVGTTTEVDSALLDPNIDLLVIRGGEGGGHGLNALSTLSLAQYAASCSVFGSTKPWAAAGGIATAEGVAAALAAGASAAWVGTRFLPTTESLTPDSFRTVMREARMEDTVYTSAFDAALDIPWPADYGGRAWSNPFAQRWAGRSAEIREGLEMGYTEASAASQTAKTARASGDPLAAPVYVGESVGLVPSRHEEESAHDVVLSLGAGVQQLREAARRWSGAD